MGSRIGLFGVLLFLAIGCESKPLVKEENITTIKVTNSLFDTVAIKNISDLEKIHEITHALNNAKAELRYFKPSIILTVVYSNKRRTIIMCVGKYIKVNGFSYVIDEPIENVIN